MEDTKKQGARIDRRSLFGAFGRRGAAIAARTQGAKGEQHPVVKLAELVRHDPDAIKKFLTRLGESKKG